MRVRSPSASRSSAFHRNVVLLEQQERLPHLAVRRREQVVLAPRALPRLVPRRGEGVAGQVGLRVLVEAHAERPRDEGDGDGGLTFLAWGTREPNDICWYPRSKKMFWRGVGVIGRIEELDYWDGEEAD